MEKGLSIAIRNLRVPLALLIVLGHSDILHFPLKSGGNVAIFDPSFIFYPIAYLCRVLFAPANSMFFAISGYLFFVHCNTFGKNEYILKIRKRFHSLFIPYVIWQLLFLLPSFLSFFTGRNNIELANIFRSIWSCPGLPIPADPPLWFLRDLMVCIIISPIYFFVLRKIWLGLICLLFLGACWFCEVWPLPQPNGFSSLSILFFSFGSFVGIHKLKCSEFLTRYGSGFVYLFLFVSVIDLLTTDYVPQGGGDILVICNSLINNSVILIACIVYPYLAIRFEQIFNKIDLGGSFIIYASHWGFLIVINVLISRFCPTELSAISAFALFVMRVAFAFIGALIISRIIKRSSLLLKLLAGGRS